MSTAALVTANQQNARKSTGPIPTEGNAAAQVNALKSTNGSQVVNIDTLIAGWRAKWVRFVGHKRFRFLRVGPPKWVRLVISLSARKSQPGA